MRKLLCGLLSVLMVLSMIIVCSAEGEQTYSASDMVYKSDKDIEVGASGATRFERGGYFGIKGVDLTGIKSVSLTGKCILQGGVNGESLEVRVDDPVKGACLGYITVCDETKTVFTSSIDTSAGVHDVYFVCAYGKANSTNIAVTNVTFSSKEYVNTNAQKKVADSAVIDNYHDTWVATDDMGRSVADYEEVGGVKTDGRTVGILYWNWFADSGKNAVVTSRVLALHPEAKDDYNNSAWDVNGTYYWGEPLLGYYTSYDYWVYRKHGELLADAGVDAIFFDYSNSGLCYVKTLLTLAQAFRDSKATGVKVPKISCMMSLGGNPDDAIRSTKTIYQTCFKYEDFSDIWFYLDGKPLLYGNVDLPIASGAAIKDDTEDAAVLKEINSFFTFRYEGSRAKGPKADGSNEWVWLENFPLHLWNKQPDGRVEFMAVGTGINESYVLGPGVTGVFSNEYNKGRGYSEAFSEDYTANGKRMAYFFREQSAQALSVGPEFVMIDGWNEWTAIRNAVYNGFKNSFVDNFDDENSRDFEPSAGVLRDDYYNLLTDFIRKYKGVRPAGVASAAAKIDINGDAAQWSNVGPEFITYNDDYQRDSYGLKDGKTGQAIHYTTTVNNAISTAKVARDSENFYFMVKTIKDIKTGTQNW
ncbi:MAG: hypothetical protein Q8882_07620, partial [Bacillota bacterium]|nr:hypothetical protein [Bacillota bacterium]